MAHHNGRTLTGHRTKAWSVAVSAALILTGFAGVPPAHAVASESPIPTWGTGPMPPSNPSGPQWQTGRVYAITRANGRIYLGGAFTQAVAPDGSTPLARPGLMAINAATGEVDALFDAQVNGQVWSLAASPDGNTIYVGGQFTGIGGASKRNLAAVNSTTGQAVPGWTANADQAVQSLAVSISGGRVFAGGKFGTITAAAGTQSRSHLVALNAVDGSVVTGWSGSVTGGNVDCGRSNVSGPPYVRALTVSADRLLVGGCFVGLNGTTRNHMGALNATTGALDTTFRPLGGREVYAIATDGSRVYASQGGGGGEGTAFDPATGRIIWSVHGDGNFQGLAVMGGLVYFGGHFGGTNLFVDALGNNYDRNKLAAVNAATGAIFLPFEAQTNSPLGIFVVRNSGNFLDVGGDFTLAGPASNMERVAHFAQFPVSASAPGTPTSLQAVAGNGSASLSWIAPEDGGSDILDYTVATRINAATQKTQIVAGDVTTQLITGLTNGTPYTFTVTARNAVESGPAAASTAVTPAGPPGAPGAASAVAGDGAATVSWSAPSNNGGSPVTGYVVTPAVSGAPGASRTFTSTATTQTVTGLANGTTYSFTVAGQNAKGTGPVGAASAPVTPVGVTPASVNTQVLGAVQSSGYWLLGETGTVYPFGAAQLYGTPAAGSLSGAADDLQETPSGNGYWIVDTAGQVHAFGDARWLGNADRKVMAAGEQVTSLAATASGQGYWLFTSRGRVFARGDARHLGDVSTVPLNGPVLDSIATPSGSGYYMVASDGGIFAFGDAAFAGSMGGQRLNSPVNSAVPDPDGAGYWLVAGDGGVFAFAAPFRGSAGSLRLNAPVVGMVSFGNGYLLVGSDGGVFNYSDRAFSGSLGGSPPARPIVSVAALS